jgi:AcrR family transcriptional regulator
MDDLAKALGMSKRTLYAYFPSKLDLLKAVIRNKFDDAEAELERINPASPQDFPVALRQLLAVAQKNLAEIEPSFLRDVQREAPELFLMLEARRRGLIERHWGKVIGRGQETGFIRKDIPVKLLNEIILGAARAVTRSPIADELDLTPKAIMSALMTVVLEGVLIRKGAQK